MINNYYEVVMPKYPDWAIIKRVSMSTTYTGSLDGEVRVEESDYRMIGFCPICNTKLKHGWHHNEWFCPYCGKNREESEFDINKYVKKNEKQTFFGGKAGFDYICFDNTGKIQCSGKLDSLLKTAKKFHWAIAILIPIKFSSQDNDDPISKITQDNVHKEIDFGKIGKEEL